jgi:hypothetical protein
MMQHHASNAKTCTRSDHGTTKDGAVSFDCTRALLHMQKDGQFHIASKSSAMYLCIEASCVLEETAHGGDIGERQSSIGRLDTRV